MQRAQENEEVVSMAVIGNIVELDLDFTFEMNLSIKKRIMRAFELPQV